jgi:hypothetical protein
MFKLLVRLIVPTACIVLCTLLPFLPGRYDVMAVPLSATALFFGRVGLLLVPVGAAWCVYERTRKPPSGAPDPHGDKRHVFAVLSLIALSVVVMVSSVGVFAFAGLSLGFVMLVTWAWIAARTGRRARAWALTRPVRDVATPLPLVVVPLAVLAVQLLVAEPATDFATNRAIDNSERMLADIERYKAERGHYPPSLLSLWGDYSPSVVGIARYLYEPSGEAYNLGFEAPTLTFGAREIVMFNPLDQQEMTSHDSDLLRRTPAELARGRGWFASHDTPRAHWKHFLFD